MATPSSSLAGISAVDNNPTVDNSTFLQMKSLYEKLSREQKEKREKEALEQDLAYKEKIKKAQEEMQGLLTWSSEILAEFMKECDIKYKQAIWAPGHDSTDFDDRMLKIIYFLTHVQSLSKFFQKILRGGEIEINDSFILYYKLEIWRYHKFYSRVGEAISGLPAGDVTKSVQDLIDKQKNCYQAIRRIMNSFLAKRDFYKWYCKLPLSIHDTVSVDKSLLWENEAFIKLNSDYKQAILEFIKEERALFKKQMRELELISPEFAKVIAGPKNRAMDSKLKDFLVKLSLCPAEENSYRRFCHLNNRYTDLKKYFREQRSEFDLMLQACKQVRAKLSASENSEDHKNETDTPSTPQSEAAARGRRFAYELEAKRRAVARDLEKKLEEEKEAEVARQEAERLAQEKHDIEKKRIEKAYRENLNPRLKALFIKILQRPEHNRIPMKDMSTLAEALGINYRRTTSGDGLLLSVQGVGATSTHSSHGHDRAHTAHGAFIAEVQKLVMEVGITVEGLEATSPSPNSGSSSRGSRSGSRRHKKPDQKR